MLLHGEPLFCIAAVFSMYLAYAGGRRDIATGIATGTILAAAAIRVPAGAEAEPAVAALRSVNSCARGLPAPEDRVTLLQWQVDGGTDSEFVRALVATMEADLVVLRGVTDASLGDALREDLGGEPLFVPADGLLLYTRGAFDLCGDDAYSWGTDGVTAVFARISEGTVFPLVAARVAGVLEGPGWGGARAEAGKRLGAMLATLESAATVVLADASAPRTYRHLDAGMRAAGLAPLAVPPNWPARIGPLPFLPLHPYDRAWAGPVWRVESSRALRTPRGTRAPVVTVLRPGAPR